MEFRVLPGEGWLCYNSTAMKIKTVPAPNGTAAAMSMYAPGAAAQKPPKRVSKIATGIALVALLAGLACASATAFLVYENWSLMSKFADY